MGDSRSLQGRAASLPLGTWAAGPRRGFALMLKGNTEVICLFLENPSLKSVFALPMREGPCGGAS